MRAGGVRRRETGRERTPSVRSTGRCGKAGALNSSLDPHLTDHVSRRFANEGLLADADVDGLQRALGDLNQRVRYALGEYEEPPQPALR